MTTITAAEAVVLSALLALVGVITSMSLSFIISRRQTRLELTKLEKTISADFEKKYVDVRLTAYQPLWQLLSGLNKDVLESEFNAKTLKGHLTKILSELETWYSLNGITLSKDAYGRFTRLCGDLDSYIEKDKFDNPADLAEIRRRAWNLRQLLREDVHIEPITPRSH